MRTSVVHISFPVLLALAACGGSTPDSGFGNGDADASGGTGADGGFVGSDGSTGTLGGDGGMDARAPQDGGVVITTTIYANTDDSLYSMDPATRAVTLIGKFTGIGGGALDTTVTDVAVDASGAVFVNTESVVYKATLPKSGAGAVSLTRVATIAAQQGQRFYALAFAPAGVLGAGETLVGGDGNGDLWAIDSTSGATKDLGSFGPVPKSATSTFALSGDIVFYLDASQKPTGLATIRSCKGTTCVKDNDYLAGIDMTALAAAYKSGTPATSLLAGIYGGSATSAGNGTGHGPLYGLGAWEGDVYAFSRNVAGNATTPATPASLYSVDTATGAATALPGTFSFTNGWSGAGVTTTVTVTVPAPPPPPK